MTASSPSFGFPSIAPAWSARAPDLATFALRRLVNRTDCLGGYWTDAKGVVTQTTLKGQRLKSIPARSRLLRHFNARSADAVVGVHAISADSTCKWVAWDIDRHSDGVDAERNWKIVEDLTNFLLSSSLEPLIEDSNGNGGYHVLVLFSSPIPSTLAHRFGKYAASRIGQPSIEVFPKQEELTPAVQFGNWLRLFGKHHKRNHWSRFYDHDNEDWLAHEAAINYLLLSAPLNDASHIERMSPRFPAPRVDFPLPVVVSSEMPVCIKDLLRNSIRRPGERNKAVLTIARWAKAARLPENEAVEYAIDFTRRVPADLTTSGLSNAEIRQNAQSVVGTVYRGAYPWACTYATSLGTRERPIRCNYGECKFIAPQTIETIPPSKEPIRIETLNLDHVKDVSIETIDADGNECRHTFDIEQRALDGTKAGDDTRESQ